MVNNRFGAEDRQTVGEDRAVRPNQVGAGRFATKRSFDVEPDVPLLAIAEMRKRNGGDVFLNREREWARRP